MNAKGGDPLPLEGAKVVDLSRLLPGPWCSQTLGDLGAEVVKIEQPEIGDYSRFNPPNYKEGSVYFHSVNRNKRSIALDLKQAEDLALARRFLRAADIVVESYRPGVTAKLGIDYATVSAENRGVIYCSVTGFGSEGELARLPGHDLSIQGAAGLIGPVKCAGLPVMPAFQVADYAAASYATIAVLAAYIQRTRTGRGRHLDIALYDSTVALSNIVLAGAMARAAGHAGKPELEVWGVNPRYAIYPTRDGKAVTVALLETATWHRFCRFIGRDDLVKEESLSDRHSDHGERAAVYRETISAICRAEDRDPLTRRMMAADIPICPAYTPDEVLTSMEAKGRGIVRTLEHPREGRITQVIDPLARAGLADPARQLAGGLGEHSVDLRRVSASLKARGKV
jgi:crotonobetainyl-CoA:carnitine CoA-transferase CaiB-like acyl-CoA transferase